jgi:hypothetical protein
MKRKLAVVLHKNKLGGLKRVDIVLENVLGTCLIEDLVIFNIALSIIFCLVFAC